MQHIRPAIVMLVLMTLLTGLLYPLGFTALAGAIFPHQAAGSLVTVDGKVIGSELIGQTFAGAKYFHGRPSAAGAGYDALASGGSNLGATSQKLKDRITADITALRPEFGTTAIPADAVTASASGLDPDISPAYAMGQAQRVAKARNLDEAAVRAAVSAATEEPVAGLFGQPRVNVLLLNMAVDRLSSGGND